MFQRVWRVLVVSSFLVLGLSACSTPSKPITVSLSPSAPQTIDQPQSVPINANVANDSQNKGVTWELSGPGSLVDVTGSSVRYASPTTQLAGPQQATVTAISVADTSAIATLQITVNPTLAITSQNLPDGTLGVAYSQTVQTVGGTPPFKWSIFNGPIPTGWSVAGNVPDGLTLGSTTGTISGTPAAGGTWYFEAVVMDSTGATADGPFLSVQINVPPAAANPIPYLSQPLVPSAVAPGGSAFTLTVNGTGFVSGATVDWNGTPLTTTFVSNEKLTATVPPADTASASTASVSVFNPSPGGGRSNLALFSVGSSAASVSFTSSIVSFQQNGAPVSVVAADFNGDGKPDIAVGSVTQVFVLLGNGDGTFNAAPNSPLKPPSPPYDDFASPYIGALAVADFTKSGHQDLAVGLTNNEVADIFLGDGSGNFAPSTAIYANSFGDQFSGVASADFNGDGNLDLAIINRITGQCPSLLGYGAGAFNMAGIVAPASLFPAGIDVGDFNHDGKLDVVVASGGSAKIPVSGVVVSLGNGDGTFGPAQGSPISLGSDLSAIVVGDFNGDGKLDIAVTDSVNNNVLILLGNGDGTFGPPTTIPVGSNPAAIVAADFNNDGNLDLAIANSGDNTVTLLLGKGDGTFAPSAGSPYSVGKVPASLAVADFNGDGKLDLAVANLNDGTVSILLQQ